MSDQPSSKPGIDAFGLTDIGRKRKQNQDHSTCYHVQNVSQLFVKTINPCR